MKLLLHTCCGPCFLGSWAYVSEFEVTNFFYNPNIQPEEEYRLRFENLKKAAKGKSVGILERPYNPQEHVDAISNDRSFPSRCISCYALRLEETAEQAKEMGFDAFSTTLLVSPYQLHGKLKDLGISLSEKFGVDFFYRDFRPNFRKGQALSKEMNIYRQRYCGCLLSKEAVQ
jgi:predicted adenine nucleotide alpha hydrolase (AANH) superfamily ATPase